MAVTARCFLGGQGISAHFADFVPQEKKYVAVIAACPSIHGFTHDAFDLDNVFFRQAICLLIGSAQFAMN